MGNQGLSPSRDLRSDASEATPKSAAFDSEEAFNRLMEDMQVLYSMKAGHVVSQADLDALNRLDSHYRAEDERATDAFHKGYEFGKSEAGGTTLAAQMEKAQAARADATVQRALAKFANADRAALLDALRAAYGFISAPQRMSTPLGGPKTATYRAEGYDALTAKIRAQLDRFGYVSSAEQASASDPGMTNK